MKNKKLWTGLLALLITGVLHAGPVEEGKAIFTSRCAACHHVNKIMTGPALAGIDQRRSIEWITQFIRSSQALIKSGDRDALAVFEQFNKVPMPDHADLNDEHIKSIVEFIKSEAKPAGAEKAPFAKPGKKETAYKPLSLSKDYLFFLIYLAAVGMLIAVLLFAVRLNSFKREMRE